MIRYVYVAAPYSKPYPVANVRNALSAGQALMESGIFPYVPHQTMLWDLIIPNDYEFYMKLDLAWIERCDALVRLPGESPGADREVEYAEKLGMPVFYSVQECVTAFRSVNERLPQPKRSG